MKTAVSALIIEDKRLLLIKRGRQQELQPCLWFIPGGRGDALETPEETSIRECREELSIVFTPKKLFQNINDLGYDVYKYIGDYTGDICLQKEEIDGYAWCTYEEAKKLDLAFDLDKVLDDLKKQKYL